MKKAPQMRGFFVGETGFEPATLWSQTRCATELRYSPIPIYGVTPTGLEPVTYCLEGSCSIQLSYEVRPKRSAKVRFFAINANNISIVLSGLFVSLFSLKMVYLHTF